MYYVHKDHLGSVNVITNQTGAIEEEMSFDAWGRRRNLINWTYTGVQTTHFIDRGYTGHEHLDKFGAINMNGRIFDPVNGRFFSPDKFVQSPGFTQSYNLQDFYSNDVGYQFYDAYNPIQNLLKPATFTDQIKIFFSNPPPSRECY